MLSVLSISAEIKCLALDILYILYCNNKPRKSRIAKTKAAFNKKEANFTSKLDLNLRKKVVKCYICSIAFYGTESWRRSFGPIL
jgi:hypothetical protein